jgi:multiple sugar transport system substrate-binding protein
MDWDVGKGGIFCGLSSYNKCEKERVSMLKRKMLVRSVVIVALLALAASVYPASLITAAKNPVTIKHWVWLDNPNDPTFKEMVADFNQTHPNIRVEMELVGWNNFHDKLLTEVVAGGGPDTTAFRMSWVSEFQAMKALAPLDGYIKKWKGKADVASNLWTLLKQDSKQPTYQMPWELVNIYLYYRKDIFAKENLTPPSTMDEFLDVCKKLTKDTDGDGKIDQYGFAMRGARGGHEMWTTFAFSSGYSFFDKKGRVTINNPEVVKANQFYIDLYRKYKVVPPTAPSDGFAEILANFQSGKAAMLCHTVKSSKVLLDKLGADKVGVVPVPAGPKGRVTMFCDTQNALLANSKHKKEAFQFISWLAEKKQVDRWCRATGIVPICNSLTNEPYYQNNIFVKTSIKQIPYMYSYPMIPVMGEFTESTWPTTFQRALIGRITSQQMLDEFAAKVKTK